MHIIPSQEIKCSNSSIDENSINQENDNTLNESNVNESLDNDCLEWKSFNASKSFSFRSKNQYNWFLFQGDLEFDNDEIRKFNETESYLFFDFQMQRNFIGREWDDYFPAGPEGRIWINGKPFGAIDEFHDGASLPELGHVELRIFTGRIKSTHTLSKFGISILHKETESLYERIRFILDVLNEISANKSYEYYQIVDILDKTVRMLDISECASVPLPSIRKFSKDDNLSFQNFYSSVHDALSFLKKSLDALPKTTEQDPAISLIGYSHVDTCWLWPFNISRVKLVNTAISMLRLLHINDKIENSENKNIYENDNIEKKKFSTRFAEFSKNEFKWKFLATSSQHCKWIKEDAPDIFSEIVKEIRNGRWEANGASWVESDTTLLSGESLVRQLVKGIRFFDREVNFGLNDTKRQTVLFLPDCFGFSGNLPQIMKKANLPYFVTSKISWSEYTDFPYSTFKWRGIDGTDVIAHFVTTPTFWKPKQSTYTGTSTAFEMINTYTNYKQRNILPKSAFHTSGNGDGGGGITEKMMLNMNIMNELPRLPNVPRLTAPSLTEIFDEIERKKDELPVWDDELYLEYHRGTLTTQEEVKRQNRHIESHLHNCEWLAVLLFALFQLRSEVILNEIDSVWEDALLLQFHDALPGTSINEANNDILKRGRKVLKKLEKIENDLSNLIALKIENDLNQTVVFNTLSHERKFAGVSIPSGGWTVLNSNVEIEYDDTETTFYKLKRNDDFPVKKIKTNFISTTLQKSPTNGQKVTITSDKSKAVFVKTPFLSIIFNENGSIKSVKDVKTGREFLSSAANKFELFEDRPINWPAWDIQRYHKEMQLFESIQFDGYDFTSHHSQILMKYSIKGNRNITSPNVRFSTINQTITFSEDSPSIDFTTVVNWTEHDKLLKVAFPTSVRSKFARFGIQFGHITRSTHKNTLRDFAKFEASGRWADLSDANGGVSLMSDVKSGFDVHEDVIRMSLLKSPMQPDSWADFGVRKFAYRAVFHSTPFEESRVPLLSDELICPVCLAGQKSIQKILENSVGSSSLNYGSVFAELFHDDALN
ncbi:Alpha-mannosidase 2C1 [Tritrichomonas musculus]|uniref:Alpha-mannosidase 2C1 n=1 Tax=Tritrichomonas musculus TaxID=1915356 RepID=A0ABR2KUM5_9EUKA